VAYDRLLERLYSLDGDWVVKGATALMARNLGTRGTLDIDVYREMSLAVAEADLRHAAAAADIGDCFRFEVCSVSGMLVKDAGAKLTITGWVWPARDLPSPAPAWPRRGPRRVSAGDDDDVQRVRAGGDT
jgi:hypothetical protein